MNSTKSLLMVQAEAEQADRLAKALERRRNTLHKIIAGLSTLPVDRQWQLTRTETDYRTLSRQAIDARIKADKLQAQADRMAVKMATAGVWA
jgi:hypothetical protein